MAEAAQAHEVVLKDSAPQDAREHDRRTAAGGRLLADLAHTPQAKANKGNIIRIPRFVPICSQRSHNEQRSEPQSHIFVSNYDLPSLKKVSTINCILLRPSQLLMREFSETIGIYLIGADQAVHLSN